MATAYSCQPGGGEEEHADDGLDAGGGSFGFIVLNVGFLFLGHLVQFFLSHHCWWRNLVSVLWVIVLLPSQERPL